VLLSKFIATIIASIVAASGALAHDASQLTDKVSALLAPATQATSVPYARVPRTQPAAAAATSKDATATEAASSLTFAVAGTRL